MRGKYIRKKGKIWHKVYVTSLLIISLVIVLKIYVLPAQFPSGEYGGIGSIQADEPTESPGPDGRIQETDQEDLLSSIPDYSGTPTYVLNDNRPEFSDAELGFQRMVIASCIA